MNYANLAKSERLQRLYGVLKDRKWHTTREIIRAGDLCAINSAVAELRRNGYQIFCRPKGWGVYEYRYVRRAA